MNYRKMIRMPVLILGGGSNILFTRDFEGIIIRINTRGIEAADIDHQHVLVTVQAGENWDGVVQHCIKNGWAGLENLSLIPGTAGAAPIQNIGAYGVEVKEWIDSVHFVEIDTGEEHTLTSAECRFAYRDSIFKNDLKGKTIISRVSFRLKKTKEIKGSDYLKLDYGDIQGELRQLGITDPGLPEVREAICNIRRRKLPDPEITGNAGSFFKNPYLSIPRFANLKQNYPSMPSFPAGDLIKVPAAWFITECGWKGYRSGDAGVYPEQPLVLVNYGHASGSQILELSEKIISSVKSRFGISLEPEVNVV